MPPDERELMFPLPVQPRPANAFLERTLGVPLTTPQPTTIGRLVARDA